MYIEENINEVKDENENALIIEKKYKWKWVKRRKSKCKK